MSGLIQTGDEKPNCLKKDRNKGSMWKVMIIRHEKSLIA